MIQLHPEGGFLFPLLAPIVKIWYPHQIKNLIGFGGKHNTSDSDNTSADYVDIVLYCYIAIVLYWRYTKIN